MESARNNQRNSDSHLINFFHHKLQPKVSCSTVGADDYPVENLISSDFNISNRGFIGYLSKPPISLDIVLMCPIQLVAIKIWPEVGSLKSTGFEIFATMNGRCTTENEKIASCDNLDENCVVFCRLNDSSARLEPGNAKKCFFFRNLRHNATVSKLTIRIFKTKNSSVPVLKRIEVWGKLTYKYALNEQILNLWRSRDADPKQLEPQQCEPVPLPSAQTSNEIQIPEELLDAITHQLMTVPMTLPSGKTVDQSTLDKFNKIEATWGRAPSDPFTGMSFTNSRKPIFNSALKATIDKVLTRHPNAVELNNVPRTVGTAIGKRSLADPAPEVEGSSDSSKRLKLYFGSPSNGIDVSDDSMKYLMRPAVKETICCCKCGSAEELYRIKICEKDFLCRSCLFRIDFVKCSVVCRCQKPFTRSDVERHFSSRTAFNYHLS